MLADRIPQPAEAMDYLALAQETFSDFAHLPAAQQTQADFIFATHLAHAYAAIAQAEQLQRIADALEARNARDAERECGRMEWRG